MVRICNILILIFLLLDIAYCESGSGAKAVYSKVSQMRDVDDDGITDGQALIWNNTTKKYEAGDAGGSAGGADTNVQYNDGGAFGGDSNFVWDKTNKKLTLTNTGDNSFDINSTDTSYIAGRFYSTAGSHVQTDIEVGGSRGRVMFGQVFGNGHIRDPGEGRYIYRANIDSCSMGDNNNTQDVWFYGQQILDPTTPAQLTADVNDYSILKGWARLSSDASRNITGIAENTETAPEGEDSDGAIIYITNVGSNDIVLKHEDVSSTATNRILSNTGVDITLSANEIAMCIYDQTTGRWRCHEM